MELLDEKDLEQATGGSDIVDGKVLVDGDKCCCGGIGYTPENTMLKDCAFTYCRYCAYCKHIDKYYCTNAKAFPYIEL